MSAEISEEQIADRKAEASSTPLLMRNRFQIVAEVGRGGTSRVFKAIDLVAQNAGLSDPEVALKIIPVWEGIDPDLISLMHREARRLRELVHPNIIRVYDMDVDGIFHFMIMEYLEGQSLARVLREANGAALSLAQVNRLVSDLAGALEFAHASNIIHADLKPGNIFIERTGRVKLIDFNIAWPVARRTRVAEEDTVEILGRLGALTPIYASPQRLAHAEPCVGDDVFSLGVIVYIALTGKRPFGEHDAREAVEKGIVPEQPEGLSARRWRALQKAMAFDDQDRTPSVARFAREFMEGPALPRPFGLFGGQSG